MSLQSELQSDTPSHKTKQLQQTKKEKIKKSHFIQVEPYKKHSGFP